MKHIGAKMRVLMQKTVWNYPSWNIGTLEKLRIFSHATTKNKEITAGCDIGISTWMKIWFLETADNQQPQSTIFPQFCPLQEIPELIQKEEMNCYWVWIWHAYLCILWRDCFYHHLETIRTNIRLSWSWNIFLSFWVSNVFHFVCQVCLDYCHYSL